MLDEPQNQEQPEQPGTVPTPDERPHHIADEPLPEPDRPDATVQKPVTDTGLPVERQIRKKWDPKKDGGLPILLETGPR